MNLFPGFTKRRVRRSGAVINLVQGGEGPPDEVLGELRRFLARIPG